jgi:hypothetical protein
MLIRIVNALLGLYLFTSAFLWTHGLLAFFNAVVTGLIVMGFGMAAILGRQNARRVNFGMGVWLFISTLSLPPGLNGSLGVMVNQLVVAALLITTSLVPAHVNYQDAAGSA